MYVCMYSSNNRSRLLFTAIHNQIEFSDNWRRKKKQRHLALFFIFHFPTIFNISQLLKIENPYKICETKSFSCPLQIEICCSTQHLLTPVKV